MNRLLYILLFFLFIPVFLWAREEKDSVIASSSSKYPNTSQGISFRKKQLVVPGILMATGLIIWSEKDLDKDIKRTMERHAGSTGLDNIFPFVPAASVYILNACNIRGRHNFIDRTAILGTSALFSIGPVFIMKESISRKRPNENGNNSFPSMHTAAAFMAAEYLFQEYKHISPWIGVAGYGMAAGTGFLRMYNNRHWLSDVLFGAGFGILGTRAAYWLYPEIRKWYAGIFPGEVMLSPRLTGNSLSLSLSAVF